MKTLLSKPMLYDSQLKFRLELALERLNRYPVNMNFVVMDLERPSMRNRHCDWWTYDMSGRTLGFFSLAADVTGKCSQKLRELYERIMNLRNPSGTFGTVYWKELIGADDTYYIGTHFISGLVYYYRLTGDMRALDAADDAASFLLRRGEDAFKYIRKPNGPNVMFCWLTEAYAELYKETQNEKYLDAIRYIAKECVGLIKGAHSHGYLTTLRGILKAAIYSGDEELAEFVRLRYQEIMDKGCILPNGDVSESFLRLHRSEGCSIADWIMLNLYYADYFGDDEAFARAEHSLWNALYFNQFVTGGFGHRNFNSRGYGSSVEEAWWCCTQNSGMALTEVARHVVTYRDNRLKLNFFIPGSYTLLTKNGEVSVSVTTRYPTEAKAVVKVVGTKDDIDIRIPECMRDFTAERIENEVGYELHLTGRIGHYVEKHGNSYVVKYGPLVIAPMFHTYEPGSRENTDTTVPEGYVQEGLSGENYKISPGCLSEDGFYHFERTPLPDWIVFEEGEMAEIGGGEVASAYVPVTFPDGTKKSLYFQPLCSATSNLTLKDMIAFFDSVDEA